MTLEDASRHLHNASDDDPTSHSPNGPTANQLPSWPRPRTPIPPHRLAKLANALGISAPVPRSQTSNDSLTPVSPLSLSKPLTPELRRSPAPSVASTPQLISHSPVPFFQSKFLLHVVPPLHIPHETDSDDFQITPPPSSASGYHTQFKRGILVPLLPTLQSQLWAIAKEYALPSTAGMVLYLVSSAQSPSPEASLTVSDEPGPRLSEDIWKHLWMRVTRFETETSRLTIPTTAAGLGFGYAGAPSPVFPQEFPSSSNTLRPLISPGQITQPFPLPLTPTGSITSSNPPTQATSSETSRSEEVHTPDSSLAPESRAATLDLPGLTSPSLVPVLAKVEFDIDKRKAAWYGPWIRSRKLNHQKREQRARTASDAGTSLITEDVSRSDTEAEVPKAMPLPLRLVDRQAIPRFLLSASEEADDYPRLSESPTSLEDPNLDSIASSEPVETESASLNGDDETMWKSQERPKLALDIPSSPPRATVQPPLPTTEAVTTAMYKKAAPPPLTLMPYSHGLNISAEPSPLPTSSSTGLAYLRDSVSMPSDGSKRTGSVFDELDLGLDFEDTGEFDENDPNDRRRSQYVFKAKLDEIEETLVRLSPRGLQHEKTLQQRRPVSGRGPPEQGSNELPNEPTAALPVAPHSSSGQQDAMADSSPKSDKFLSPPKLSPGGILISSPVSPNKKSFSMLQDRELDESNTKRREPDGYEFTFPTISPRLQKSVSSHSPAIPLSPDPFGRYPSQPSTSQAQINMDKPLPRPRHKDSKVDAAARPSSRFSLDSIEDDTNNRTSVSLNPVKSIKSLWKKGRKASISFVSGSSPTIQTGSGPGPGPTPQPPPPPPPVPNLSSTSSTSTRRSPIPDPSRTSHESVASLAIPPDRHLPKALYRDTPSLSTSQLQQSRSNPSIDTMFFNQESPYPIHVIPPHSTARPQTASQAARLVSSASLNDVKAMSSTMATDREKAGAPRSILKSRRPDSSASSLPPEQHAIRKSLSRPDTVVRSSTLTGGGGRVTSPSSFQESTRFSTTSSRRRSSRATVLSQPSQEDETFKTIDPVPRLELDQRTR